jgi:hypothetical protein
LTRRPAGRFCRHACPLGGKVLCRQLS